MEIKGKIVQAFGVETGTSKAGKDWQKASLVIETEGQYPKKILLTNFKHAEEFAALTIGTMLIFSIDIESREWKSPTTGKISWFTEVSCYRWETPRQAALSSAATAAYGTHPTSTQPAYAQQYVQQQYVQQPAQQSYEHQPVQQPYTQPVSNPYAQPYVQPPQQQAAGQGGDELPF